MAIDDDRTVHAGLSDGGQIARYDRSGKYYLEYSPATGKKRRALKIGDAVQLAVAGEGEPGAYIAFGRSGGLAFDAKAHRAQRELRKAQQ